MADLSKVKIGESVYTLKDAQARTDVATAQGAITAEVTRATGVESGLDTRISNLEARGRYLSTWDAATGLPADYPEIPSGAESPYTYTYKAGDYYIINNVPTSGKLYMPDGASITATKEGETWTWTVGKKEYSGSSTLVVGGQFVNSTSGWNYVATAKDVAWGNITGTLSDQSDLNTALGGKLGHKTGKSGTAGDLAYKDSASASYTPAGTISEVDATPAGEVTLNDFTQTSTAATISAKADYTPAGTITGSAISGGSISVSVKDAASATPVTDLTYENYTPQGTIAAKATGGTSSVLDSATFEKDASGVAISGTVSAPSITVTAGSEKTFATGLTGGKVASIDTTKFSGGSFTGASAASFTQGTDTFNQGSQASLTTSNISYVESGVVVAMDTTDTEMLVFTDVTAKSAKAVDTFTANTLPTYTQGTDSFTPNVVGKFTAAAISDGFFTANELQSVETGTVHDTPTAALAEAPTFTGDKFRVATTTDTVLKDVEFTGTAAAVKLTGAKYLKQEIDKTSFSGTAATLGFSGTKSEQLIPTEVKYDKATKNGATFAGTTNKITPTFSGTDATITVE